MVVYYKSVRFINGKSIWVVEDEEGNINKDPTKEQLTIAIADKRTKIIRRKCCVCNGGNATRRYYDEKGYWNGRDHICDKCDKKKLWGPITNCRNKLLSKNCSAGKGFTIEQVIAIYLGIKNCNIEMDNFNFRFDLSPHIIDGKIQVMGLRMSETERWNFGGKDLSGRVINSDTVYLICMDKIRKNIERAYRVPSEDIVGIASITIVKNPPYGSKWTKYRLNKDEEKKINDIYHSLDIYKCPVLDNRF